MGYSGRLLIGSSLLALSSFVSLDARAQDIGTGDPHAPPAQTAQPAQPGAPPPGQVVVVQPPAQPTQPKKPRPVEKEWYGWQTLIADAASVALYVGGREAKTESIYDVGIGTYLLATPVIHIVHGNVGPAFGSLGMRLIIPPVAGGFGFVLGLIIAGNRNADFGDVVGGGVVGFYAGLLTGIGAAIAIDAAFLAWEKITPDDNLEYGKAKRPKDRPWFSLTPTFGPTPHGGGQAGVVGTF